MYVKSFPVSHLTFLASPWGMLGSYYPSRSGRERLNKPSHWSYTIREWDESGTKASPAWPGTRALLPETGVHSATLLLQLAQVGNLKVSRLRMSGACHLCSVTWSSLPLCCHELLCNISQMRHKPGSPIQVVFLFDKAETWSSQNNGLHPITGIADKCQT